MPFTLRPFRVTLLASVIATYCLAAAAQPSGIHLPGAMTDAQWREQDFRPLIEDELFRAWKLEPWHEGHWTLADGVINYDGKAKHGNNDKKSLWTQQDYGDVQVYVEWRLPAKPRMKRQPIVLFNGDFLLDDAGKRITRPGLDAGDSGILLR